MPHNYCVFAARNPLNARIKLQQDKYLLCVTQVSGTNNFLDIACSGLSEDKILFPGLKPKLKTAFLNLRSHLQRPSQGVVCERALLFCSGSSEA
jgi:hypothetical protein